MNYLEVPLFLRFDVPAIPFITPYLEFGGYFGYLLSGTIEGTSREAARFFEDRLQPVDGGLHVGGGTTYEVGPVQLQLSVRYQVGLVETVKNLNIDNTFDFQPDIFNRSLTFMLGVGF